MCCFHSLVCHCPESDFLFGAVILKSTSCSPPWLLVLILLLLITWLISPVPISPFIYSPSSHCTFARLPAYLVKRLSSLFFPCFWFFCCRTVSACLMTCLCLNPAVSYILILWLVTLWTISGLCSLPLVPCILWILIIGPVSLAFCCLELWIGLLFGSLEILPVFLICALWTWLSCCVLRRWLCVFGPCLYWLWF